jgi:L-alanine-DL-glutamate epimerase-like enolase superfamily enzyme
MTAGNASLKVIDVLTTFSGEGAEQYEPYFRFSEQARIVSVEIYAVGTESTTARYTDEPLAWKDVNNILRITTADGYEAISGVTTNAQDAFSDKHLTELQSVTPVLLALNTLDPVEVGAILERTRPDLSDKARSSIDIALWDLAARKVGLPLYKLLGEKRHSIEPYASLPFYDSLPTCVAAVEEYAKLGFKTFKFHAWGQIEKDSQLVDVIKQTFAGTPYKFMIDFENAYDLDAARKLAEMTDDELFIWFEAPIDDTLFEQYAELRSALAMSIIPSGYKNYSAEFIREGIEKKSWDAGRFDVTVVGGFSKALELMIIANTAGLPIEIQSWDHSLSQAANLHLMLANERTEYFEAPMPKAAFEFGMKNGNLLKQGQIVAPEGPGLGIDVDWERLNTADFYRSSKI